MPQDGRSTGLHGNAGGRVRPRRRARVPAARDHEPARTRLLHDPRPLNYLLDNPNTTQNAGNIELTGDPTSLLDGARRKEMTTGWWLRWFSRLSHGSKELLGG